MCELKENKFMRGNFLAIALILIIIHIGSAQNSFHRTYPSVNDKDLLCISSVQLKDGNYVALELELQKDENEIVFSDTFIVTSYKPKGDINWTKAFAVEMSQAGNIAALGSIIQGDNDSIYYSIITGTTEHPNKIIGALDRSGANGWMKSYTSAPGKADGLNSSHLLANYNKTLFSGHVGGTAIENDLALSRKDYNGKNIWSGLLATKNINGINIDENLTHLSFESDTSILMGGTIDSNNLVSFLVVTDTLGRVQWSRTLKSANQQNTVKLLLENAVRLPDSTYVASGVLHERGMADKGFVLKINKRGDIIWGKKIAFGSSDTTLVKYMALDKNNKIFLAGVNSDVALNKSYNYVIKLKDDGSVDWKKKYPRVDGTLDFTGNLFGTKDGGTALITSVVEDQKLRPSFIKLDAEGSSSCEENIDVDILFDNSYGSDTLIWTFRSVGSDTLVTYTSKPYSYDVPVVTLEVRPFCPEEPIDWTFHAKTKGAVYYKWSTGVEGADKDSLRVFEEGKYSVTVTINEGVCFMLCDTSELARYDKPEVQLGLSLGNFCANNKQTINAGYVPGHPQIKSAVWSTGETNKNFIEIDKPGTYKITIVDGCDESASAEISVGEFPKKITSATISSQVAIDCFEGTATGILTASGNSNGLGAERYLWSSGQNTKAISINDTDTKTYRVTVIDGCGGTATATQNIEIDGPGITTADIVINKDGLCSTRSIALNAVANRSGRFQYIWSTAETTPRINVSAVGSYAVTITDLCGNKASNTIDVREEDLTPKDVEYAHVFFPDGVGYQFEGGSSTDTMSYQSLILNRTFGPVNLPEYCLNQIDNYEFYVFNRWGQQVFESKDITDEWDGNLSGKDSPSDTYVWVVKYNIFGFEKTKKGDVTMIRK
jgi:gliding motility-associated-like protein